MLALPSPRCASIPYRAGRMGTLTRMGGTDMTITPKYSRPGNDLTSNVSEEHETAGKRYLGGNPRLGSEFAWAIFASPESRMEPTTDR